MAKPIKNVFKGVGKVIGSLFGIKNATKDEVPQAPPLPPPPPPTPMPQIPTQAIRPLEPQSAIREFEDKFKDPKRVSRRRTIKTSARGVTEGAPVAYRSLLGNSKANS